MAKRSYTEVVIDLEKSITGLETTNTYIENHLGNIDSQLEKLNNTVHETETRVTILETTTGNPTRGVKLSKAQAIGIGSGLFLFGSFIAGIIVGLF